MGYIRSNTVSFAKENFKDLPPLPDPLPSMRLDETKEQYLLRLRTWRDERSFNEDRVIGELDEEFEAIPYEEDIVVQHVLPKQPEKLEPMRHNETLQQYTKRLNRIKDEKYPFDDNLVIGELDEEFETIPYDGEE